MLDISDIYIPAVTCSRQKIGRVADRFNLKVNAFSNFLLNECFRFFNGGYRNFESLLSHLNCRNNKYFLRLSIDIKF